MRNLIAGRRPLTLLVATAALVALAACGSSGGSAASGPTVTPRPGDAQKFTPPPVAKGVAPAYTWCSALAKAQGGGVEATGVSALTVGSLKGLPEYALAAKVWSDTNTELGRCEIGKPITGVTPVATTASQCPSGHGTVRAFPPTVAYLVDAKGKTLKLGSGAKYQPQPALTCT